MGWITHGFKCIGEGGCSHETVVLFDRAEERPAAVPCERCGLPAVYAIGAAIAVASHPDGSTNRFQGLREQQVLRKARNKAHWRGDKREKARVDRELKKL